MFEVNHIKKSYSRKGKNVLDGVSFQIGRGEIVGVLGVNGAGKTTLIKSMMKLLEIDSGEIRYENENIIRIANSRYYRTVAAVLEGNRNLYWYLTGMENIMYFCSLRGMKKSDIIENAEKYLKLFELYNDKDKSAGEYSRGMQQKLSIIIALLGNPEILFLDEPTLGLDVQTKRKVIEVLKDLARQKQMTIFITSHQLDVIDLISDKLLVLQNGKILYDGDPYAFKEKYSKNKYSISVVGKEVDDYLAQYSCEVTDQVIHISLSGMEYDDIFRILSEMKEKGYEVIAFKKDTFDLEEIMIHCLEDMREL